MTTLMVEERGARRLPSVDWIAFAVGALGLALGYLYPPALGLVALAVFAPSLLREIGVLRDADEFTARIMHRAGFHALLTVAGLYCLNYLLSALNLFDAAAAGTPAPIADDTLRKGAVWVFLLSYLIQYWGARQGVFRVLLGISAVLAISLVGFVEHFDEQRPLAIAVVLANAVVFAALALLVRRWPRAGGGTLLALGVAAFLYLIRDLGDPRVVWGTVQVMLQVVIVFGATGVVLLRATAPPDG